MNITTRSLIIALFSLGALACAAEKNKEIPTSGQKREVKNIEKGKEGNSATPIKIDAITKEEVKEFQRNYIEKYYPGFTIRSSALGSNLKRATIEGIYLKNDAGEVWVIYFDVSNYFKHFEKTHKKELKKMLEKQRRAILKMERSQN